MGNEASLQVGSTMATFYCRDCHVGVHLGTSNPTKCAWDKKLMNNMSVIQTPMARGRPT